MELWLVLVADPATTLPAASCLRGQLLRVVSLLIDSLNPATGVGAAADAVTAVLRVLELNPNAVR